MKSAEKCPSMPETVLMSTPFCSAMVAKVCLRSWNLTSGIPALASTLLSILLTLSGEIGPPLLVLLAAVSQCHILPPGGSVELTRTSALVTVFVLEVFCNALHFGKKGSTIN